MYLGAMKRNAAVIRLLLGGDVMLGRALDQALEHPGDPRLREPLIEDARDYLALAERKSGQLGLPLGPAEPWGELLPLIDAEDPDHWIINLETSITYSEDFCPYKSIHYRMSPANLAVLRAGRVDCCCLANNHVMDFGQAGLLEPLSSLEQQQLAYCGAGRTREAARAPLVLGGGGALRLINLCFVDSGVSPHSEAGADSCGVFLLHSMDQHAVDQVLRALDGPYDCPTLVSLHWGGNWGYRIPEAQRSFAHALLDSPAVDLVFGHSSHHPKEIELYRGKAAIYGGGDLINDYEGIRGHTQYRPELALVYIVELERGALRRLEAVPFRRRRLRLERADLEAAEFLRQVLNGQAAEDAFRTGTNGHLQATL